MAAECNFCGGENVHITYNKPVDFAVCTTCNQLVVKGEWQRLYIRLMNTYISNFPQDPFTVGLGFIKGNVREQLNEFMAERSIIPFC